jgi:hypothetical protein
MPDTMNVPDSHLFVGMPVKGSDSRRCIVLRDTDLRLVLATGRLGPPSWYSDFTPLATTLDTWSTCSADSREVVRAIDPKRACLVVLSTASCSDSQLKDTIPASELEEVRFPSEAAKRQWVARTQSMEGLPDLLPCELTVTDGLPIGLLEEPTVPRWHVPAQLVIDRADRVAGGLLGMLIHGHLNSEAWTALLRMSTVSERELIDLWCLEHGTEPEAVGAVLRLLEDPKWGIGFDPESMLAELKDSLQSQFDSNTIRAWSEYVGAVLSNRIEAKADGLLDHGKTLLRALELLLRTPQPSVARVANEIRVRTTGQHPTIGNRVGQQCLALAGWFEGFAATGRIVKSAPGLYQLGCRVTTASPRFPMKLVQQTVRHSGYSRERALLHDGHVLLKMTEQPPPLLLKALHSSQEVCSQYGWKCSFDEETYAIRVEHADWQIVARVADKDTLRWRCELQVPKTAKQRSWPKGFVEYLLSGNTRWPCSVGSDTGFPRLVLTHHQLLSTLDDEEVKYVINAMIRTREAVLSHDLNRK